MAFRYYVEPSKRKVTRADFRITTVCMGNACHASPGLPLLQHVHWALPQHCKSLQNAGHAWVAILPCMMHCCSRFETTSTAAGIVND